MKPRGLIAVGLVLMAAFTGLMLIAEDVPGWIAWPFVAAFGLALAGTLLLDGVNPRLGARLIIISGFFFFPLGSVAMAGARLELDAIARRQFRQRRIES